MGSVDRVLKQSEDTVLEHVWGLCGGGYVCVCVCKCERVDGSGSNGSNLKLILSFFVLATALWLSGLCCGLPCESSSDSLI